MQNFAKITLTEGTVKKIEFNVTGGLKEVIEGKNPYLQVIRDETSGFNYTTEEAINLIKARYMLFNASMDKSFYSSNGGLTIFYCSEEEQERLFKIESFCGKISKFTQNMTSRIEKQPYFSRNIYLPASFEPILNYALEKLNGSTIFKSDYFVPEKDLQNIIQFESSINTIGSVISALIEVYIRYAKISLSFKEIIDFNLNEVEKTALSILSVYYDEEYYDLLTSAYIKSKYDVLKVYDGSHANAS